LLAEWRIQPGSAGWRCTLNCTDHAALHKIDIMYLI
jgi:hypothetical protein